MCLIVFAWQVHAEAPLLLAANRDEFHARPTAGADFWEDAPGVLAGRDLEAGGTWLGVHRSGRFAGITNIRDPRAGELKARRSRGELTAEFLSGTEDPVRYLAAVAEHATDYLGFNLLVSDGRTLAYLHGDGAPESLPRVLEPGVYGLSNAALDVPWPKVTLAKKHLQETLETRGQSIAADDLRRCLSDRALAEAEDLEGQGLEGEMARRLSAQFIITERYGTRCTTTLNWRADGAMEFTEQRFGADGELNGSDEFLLDTTRA